MSVNHLNNLPFLNSSCLYSERHLQAQTICRIHNGLDGRFDNSTRAQFNEHAVAYFMFAHTNVGAIFNRSLVSPARGQHVSGQPAST
jgi:hypothetical protein